MWVTRLVRPSPPAETPALAPAAPSPTPPRPAPRPTAAARTPRLDVGPTVRLSGTLTGAEDVAIDGSVEGTIEVPGHCVTLGSHARVAAPIFARRVRIAGQVIGDVTATEAVEVEATGSVHGNILAPAVAIADGARFSGSIDMRPGAETRRVPAPVAAPVMALAG